MKRRRALFLAIVVTSQLALGEAQVITASASFPQGSGLGQDQGFDVCTDPTEAQMSAFWVGSPYYWAGAYIGGSEMACSQPNLSSTWLSDERNQGWSFEFLWVGLQAPCTTYKNKFSSNTTTAFSQGQSEAINAVNTLINNLGVVNPAQSTAVTFDLDISPSACQAATNAFISGWDYQLSLSPAQESGVYGAVCASSLQSLAGISHVPVYIWGGNPEPDGNMSTKDLWYDPGNCGVTSGSWAYNQRIKQWRVNHSETWNNVTLSVDDDCANTWVNPVGTGTDPPCIA